MKIKSTPVFLLLCVTTISNIWAHGDLHERIIEATKEIKINPDSSYLYVKRGKLYFQHEVYRKSIKDLKKSERLGFYSPEQQFILAKSTFRLKKYDKALDLINSLLEKDKFNVRYFKFKAQVLFADKAFEASAINFENVIKYSNKTFPENYLDASLAWENSSYSNSIENAKEIIKRGLVTIGPLTVLYDRLIDISIKQEEYDEAIRYQTIIVGMNHRKESAYFKLYKLYKLNNEDKKAAKSLAYAKQHLEKLPERIKNTSFVKSLKNDIEQAEKITLTY